ncbi:hypothetical protein [Leptolyngbya iicbica]|uniref:Uncharacterized protein n=2 Tax=Cyanophyceae TaxID=3028117 RepID=A0A4Q7E4V9_9CYAN|nr:hypothetical protein [Leptolyngbya sp. LK]RZM75092.1 hypothetical protein DYY88_22130 [Leptolyngbya sp. LK]
MNPFSPVPPTWSESAVHAYQFGCPRCGANVSESAAVWINRRSPVYTDGHRRKWQEFYQCGECQSAWWAWSSDRPPTEWSGQHDETDEPADITDDPFDF